MGSFFSSSAVEWQATSKNVVITGASSGIGAEMARNFAREGANLALLARSGDKLEEIRAECIELGSPKAEIYKCDLTKNEEIDSATNKAIQDFTHFDVVFLNAGRSQGCYFEEIRDPSQIDYMLRLNVNGVIRTLYKLLPSIHKSEHSRIAINSSVSGMLGVPYRTIYCASKHAITGFANALRMELRDTHGSCAPAICLINFPEVAGTQLNSGRMDFGAERPPAEFDIRTALRLENACRDCFEAIRVGRRQWGEPAKIRLLLPLCGFIPEFLDRIVMKSVKANHYRPDKLILSSP